MYSCVCAYLCWQLVYYYVQHCRYVGAVLCPGPPYLSLTVLKDLGSWGMRQSSYDVLTFSRVLTCKMMLCSICLHVCWLLSVWQQLLILLPSLRISRSYSPQPSSPGDHQLSLCSPYPLPHARGWEQRGRPRSHRGAASTSRQWRPRVLPRSERWAAQRSLDLCSSPHLLENSTALGRQGRLAGCVVRMIVPSINASYIGTVSRLHVLQQQSANVLYWQWYKHE